MKRERRGDRWWERGFFGLHYDLHAGADDKELGAELTPGRLREQLAKVRPDFVQCDCKGSRGYASYPTRVGSPSPGIVRDALRIHRDVTRELGIPLSVHFSGINNARAAELHPEWTARDAAGKPLAPGGLPILCPRSPYADKLMIPQMLEVIDGYDVDGFWVDGDNYLMRDCYCARCRAAFRRAGGGAAPAGPDKPNWLAWRAFQRKSFEDYVRKYTAAIHRRKPACAVCSNWLYSIRHPGSVRVPVDYLSGDFSPSFGGAAASLEGRYMDGHGLPWNLMAWAFCSPQRKQLPYQMKTAVHLCQELADVMACGGSVFVYDLPQRSGWLTGWHQDILAETAAFCRARQPFCRNTRSVPEAAVLISAEHMVRHNDAPFVLGESAAGAAGALYALLDNQWPADLLDETRLMASIRNYALVVVPEQDPVSPRMARALEAYVRGGGTALMSGSHLAGRHAAFLGVKPAGPARKETWHVPVGREAATLGGAWRPVRAAESEVYARVMKQQDPEKDLTDYPAVTVRRVGKGRVAAIHGDVMAMYFFSAHPRVRRFIGDLLAALPVRRRVLVEGPPSLEVALRRGRGFTALHLVNRAADPSLSYWRHAVESVPPARNIDVRLHTAGKPRRVTLEPGARAVSWRFARGWLRARIRQVDIHDILVVR